ncbi:unnamed protein product [Nippostrongylus brasiliensis]|uniref:Netrin receptor UNC5A-D-like N-terminal domain-containing protein n=1 Tax=Nippostrongylus brasiliensis TaxID=27835 RepID=A0A0N4YET6_NIPBR|nr:unnamed protein product [Nippostrongylus brasiliensis]
MRLLDMRLSGPDLTRPLTTSIQKCVRNAPERSKAFFSPSHSWKLDEARYESVLGTDPGTQLPYMQGSVEITRQEVDLGSHLEDFACQCYASGASDSHVVRSDPAQIRISCE